MLAALLHCYRMIASITTSLIEQNCARNKTKNVDVPMLGNEGEHMSHKTNFWQSAEKPFIMFQIVKRSTSTVSEAELSNTETLKFCCHGFFVCNSLNDLNFLFDMCPFHSHALNY
jgi:hypothetical protein